MTSRPLPPPSCRSVKSLTVHRNTLEKHRKRELAKDIQKHAEKMVRDNNIRAYAIIGIGADGKGYALWDTGAILPMWAFPATISAILQRDIEESGVGDDWKPSISNKGST